MEEEQDTTTTITTPAADGSVDNDNPAALSKWREALKRFAEDRDEDLTFYSDVSERCKEQICYVGIDEAGRGPVLGPMVYGIFAAVENKLEGKETKEEQEKYPEDSAKATKNIIKKLNDSKKLTDRVREEIFGVLSDLDYVAYGIKIISPRQISGQCFKRQKISLNDISHSAAMELLQGLIERGVRIGKVYVDTVGPMDKYQKKLELKFPELEFKVDKKADAKYKPVMAASICAKVTRDEVLKKWTFCEGDNVKIPSDGWGCGYPGDAVTKRFLRANIDPVFGFPNIVRDNWSTASDLLEKRAVKVKWELEEDDSGTPKISKFFAKKKKTEDEDGENDVPPQMLHQRAQFFSYRGLSSATSLF